METAALNPAGIRALNAYGLNPDLLSGCRLHRYFSGETIFRQGYALETILFVIRGTAKVCLNARNGRNLILCYYASDGMLGDVEFATGESAATATVIAVTDFLCAAVPLLENAELLKGNLAFMNRVADGLSRKLLRSCDAHVASALYTSEQRICSYILMARQNGWFREYLTDAAQTVGVSYRHVLRIMNALCEAGILSKTGSGYKIENMKALKNRSCESEEARGGKP